MKKNRDSAGSSPDLPGKALDKGSSENILVFLVIGLILLAISSFSRHPYTPAREKMFSTTGTSEKYAWVSGHPEMPDGLHVFTPAIFDETFPGLLPLRSETAGTRELFPDVAAIQYDSGLPHLVALPPRVAHVFFMPVSINRAGTETLSSLPGIGPVLAARIVQKRETAGPFRSKDELLHIPGIGPKKLAGLIHRITLD